MTCTDWNDADSQKSQFKCALRINRQSGRLQWCAGSKCVKMFVILPVTLLPIVLVFILLTHLELVGTLRQYRTNYYPLSNDLDTGDSFTFDDNDRKCVAIKYTMSETLDSEDRDVLKDIRTSFIPPDFLVLSPHCRDTENSAENKDRSRTSANERSYSYDEVIDNISSFHRGRRELNGTAASDDDEKRARSLHSPMNNSHSHISPQIHAFWKGEGTLHQIRKTQADVMLQYMDQSVNPCDDFYQYSCGNWEKLNPIPKDKAAYDTFEILRESLDDVIEELLISIDSRQLDSTDDTTPKSLDDVPNILGNEPRETDLRKKILQRRSVLEKVLFRYRKDILSHRDRPSVKASDAEIKARNLYKSCMNYDLLEKRGITPLLDLLQSLGGWPALDPKWNEENFNWLNLTAKLRLYNNDIFLVQWVGPDIKNSDENIVQFDQTSLGLPTRDYFLQQANAQYLEAYREYMSTIIHLLGSTLENAKETANEIIEFETELARITSSPGNYSFAAKLCPSIIFSFNSIYRGTSKRFAIV